MRRLLLDLGNTRLKWRLMEGGEACSEGALAHAETGFADALAALARPLRGENVRVWLASVAPTALAARVEAVLSGLLDAAPVRVRVDAAHPALRLAYRDPAQLGVDRWLAMLGARAAASGPVVVALAGTALTLDAVDGAGRHLGGLIAPGLGLQRASLTAGPLFLAEGRLEPMPFADSTAAAVASGPPLALAALIERFVRSAADRCGERPRLLLSGGDAGRLVPLLPLPAEQRPGLVLDGLARLAD
jgi:type III pantothenate kinase